MKLNFNNIVKNTTEYKFCSIDSGINDILNSIGIDLTWEIDNYGDVICYKLQHNNIHFELTLKNFSHILCCNLSVKSENFWLDKNFWFYMEDDVFIGGFVNLEEVLYQLEKYENLISNYPEFDKIKTKVFDRFKNFSGFSININRYFKLKGVKLFAIYQISVYCGAVSKSEYIESTEKREPQLVNKLLGRIKFIYSEVSNDVTLQQEQLTEYNREQEFISIFNELIEKSTKDLSGVTLRPFMHKDQIEIFGLKLTEHQFRLLLDIL